MRAIFIAMVILLCAGWARSAGNKLMNKPGGCDEILSIPEVQEYIGRFGQADQALEQIPQGARVYVKQVLFQAITIHDTTSCYITLDLSAYPVEKSAK